MKRPDKILFASTNLGKLNEVRTTLTAGGIEVLSPAAFGAPPEVDETADSYEGNARLKAAALWAWSAQPTLADDTGLEVAALNGAPGVRSARFAGEKATMAENTSRLLELLGSRSKEERAARFVCVLVFRSQDGRDLVVRDELVGSISTEARGRGGFGYDPIFIVGDTGRTLAELKEGGDCIVTHRVKALRRFIALFG